MRAVLERAEVEDLDDVLGADAPRGLRLALESGANVCGDVRPGSKDLDGDALQRPSIFPFEDDPPSTFADHSEKTVLSVYEVSPPPGAFIGPQL